MPKQMSSKSDHRNRPYLAEQIQDDNTPLPKKTRTKKPKKKNDEEFVNERMTAKILNQARDQKYEEEEEENTNEQNFQEVPNAETNEYEELDNEYLQDEYNYPDEDQFAEEIGLDEMDEATLKLFMPDTVPQRRTLADIIMEKIQEKEAGVNQENLDSHFEKGIDPKVVKVYRAVGKLLRTYRAGKLPKAFKLIPVLQNWEDILYLTNPPNWSLPAVRVATRIFASNLKDKGAQRYYELVLLPRVLEDVDQNKKLNFHLYMSLKKALFKPVAFFKGILLPLCEEGCSLKEATIVGSVLSKVSIPALPASVALLKIAEMDYTGPNSLFIRVLLDKKYALPFRVIDSVVAHFMKFANDERNLPVLWHQSLLVFAQRYKEDIELEQKESLKFLLKNQVHFQITPEIRRELFNSKSRGETNDIEMEITNSGAPVYNTFAYQ